MNIHIQNRPHYSHTTTTTTTSYHHPRAQPGHTRGCGGGAQLSSQAQMMMQMMRLMGSLMSGDFGQLMNMLQSPGRGAMNGRAGGQMLTGSPGFGQGRRAGGARRRPAVDGRNASPAKRGQAREMKAGETVRGANGSLVKWGKDGNVDITYKDKNGQNKNINVKNGMMSVDGGKPSKLGNTGQLLKLPNGDVVGLGNNPQAKGQKLCRVVMADNVDQVKCEPASATNIYDIAEMDRQQTRMHGGGVSFNYSQGTTCTPWGMQNYASASLSMFRGIPVTSRWTEQVMSLVGNK
jgi:hypothetical protein